MGAGMSEQHQKRRDHGRDAALEATRRADPQDRPDQQPEIENGESDKKPLKLHGFPPEQIVIELTERRIDDPGIVAQRAAALRAPTS